MKENTPACWLGERMEARAAGWVKKTERKMQDQKERVEAIHSREEEEVKENEKEIFTKGERTDPRRCGWATGDPFSRTTAS